MKYLLFTALLILASIVNAQILKPTSFQVSYFGETITHPGLKIGLNYTLKGWEKIKEKKNGKEKVLLKSLIISPNVIFFYHKNYQSGLLFLPEISFERKNSKGKHLSLGVGAGLMRTFIPNVYKLSSNGEIEKINAGNNYFMTNYFFEYGKDFSLNTKTPLDLYIKPQLLNALPGKSKSTWYFALEIGVRYHLATNGFARKEYK